MPRLPSLILFARAPEPGRVKTRLARVLTDAGAATLYRAFLEDAARVYLKPARWRSVLCADPPGHPALAGVFADPWLVEPQAPGGLGERLCSAFAREFARGAPACAAIGADHPALPRGRIEDLFDRLDRGLEAAVIPAEDGGYCAIGLRAGVPPALVFDRIEWSTAAVLRQTLQRMDASGVRWERLGASYDVDRPEDLDRLRRDLADRDRAAEDFPSATARALAALDAGPRGASP